MKSNWESFTSLSKIRLRHSQITKNSDVAEKNVRNAILSCAKKSIPRDKITDYKPYWSQRFVELTAVRNEAVKSLEDNWSTHKQQCLTNCQKELEKEIKHSKNADLKTTYKH